MTNILMGANNCKTEIDLECRSVKDQRHLAAQSVKDTRSKRMQKAKYHDAEISAMKKVIRNQKHWTQWENAWRNRESSRPKRNQMNSSQKSGKEFEALLIDKTVALKMERLIDRIGLDENDIYEYLMDYPNKLQEFEQEKNDTEAKLEEVTKEHRYVSRELADYKRDLRQASTKKFSELESKLSRAEETLGDKQKLYKEHLTLFANLQSWTTEMLQRLTPMAEEGQKEADSGARGSGEEPFSAKLKQIEGRLAFLLNVQAEEKKNRSLVAPSEAGSPIYGDDGIRKSIQMSSDAISTPLLGPYNIRIPTKMSNMSPTESPTHGSRQRQPDTPKMRQPNINKKD